MTWELRRVTGADGNGYDRYYDPVAGAAVVYEEVLSRQCWGFINGTHFQVDWPDTAGLFGGDHGRPVAYRIRPEYDGPETVTGWFLYAYVFSGGDNRSEWSIRLQ